MSKEEILDEADEVVEDANHWEKEELADKEMNRQQEERGNKPIITRYIPKKSKEEIIKSNPKPF